MRNSTAEWKELFKLRSSIDTGQSRPRLKRIQSIYRYLIPMKRPDTWNILLGTFLRSAEGRCKDFTYMSPARKLGQFLSVFLLL